MIKEVKLYRPRKAKKRTKVKRLKQKPLSRLKKELEALQKQIVTQKYGSDCYTCPAKNLEGANRQLGHVPWPRSDLSTKAKFDYRFTRIQCFRDNIHLGGCGALALQRMIDEGIDVVSLRNWSQEMKGQVVPRQWFVDKIAEYKAILEGENSLKTQKEMVE